ncbi:MAG TPA: penicillin acylase family protein, partial [Gemmatimonadaceae bacterium]|nr:penicillin acylase family protein [Gemmatimonadaceae bacterium]
MFGSAFVNHRALGARAVSVALIALLAYPAAALGAQDTVASEGARPGAVAQLSTRRVPTAEELAAQVVVRRTTHGVPHIEAENLEAMAYALAYVQCQDYGDRVALSLLGASGRMGRWFGRDSMDGDFNARLAYRRAVEAYPLLDQDLRDVYEGFAIGVNRYIELHPEEFPAGFAPRFTGY